MNKISRRRVLRGIINGAAVSVSLPLLNCFLNDNGTALAAGRSARPQRFGTWFWGCGINAKVFTPTSFGTNWDLPEEIAALGPVKQHINLLSNFNVFRDSAPNLCHHTAWVCARTGMVPQGEGQRPGETYDVTIAKTIGRTTRFQSLTATATGDVRTSFSYEDQNSPSPAEHSPVDFYARLFGPDFQDPNASEFRPDPRIMVRKSVLSGVMEETRSLNRQLGAEDRARLDQYFEGLRALERQVDQQLTKPEPIAGCVRPSAPQDPQAGATSELIALRHKMMTDLLVMAIACDQTRVFNMAYSDAKSGIIKLGYEKPHHTTTHEERVDEVLGYQPNASWFTRRSMESLSYFIQALANMKEGDGTLLDNCLVVAGTDHSLARVHAIEGVPIITAGRAGGQLKTGLHVDGKGTTIVRVGYTAQRVMGLELNSWGTKSNATSQAVSEILA
jgi:hypothetical protein